MKSSWSAIKTSHLYNQPMLQRRRDKQKFAQKLNREMTAAEWRLWYHLRTRGWKAQAIVCGYIPDFLNKPRGLIVELDGSSHNGSLRKHEDRTRDSVLERAGFTVLRFTNDQVFTDIKGVLLRLGYKI